MTGARADGATGTAVRLVRSPALCDAPYAYASTVDPDARLIFLAGACPLDGSGSVTPSGDYAGQAEQCIDNLTEARDVPSTLLGVTVLGYEHQLVEIEAVAAVVDRLDLQPL